MILIHPLSNLNERKTKMETEQKLQVKKEWETPELIILVRSKPEDAVLLECRIGQFGGYTDLDADCKIKPCLICYNMPRT